MENGTTERLEKIIRELNDVEKRSMQYFNQQKG